MHPLNPDFTSPIGYSVQNEDVQSELGVLSRLSSGPLRVLAVASSGENVLGLLAEAAVGTVDAVDLNPAQLHLVGLRVAALECLNRTEQLELLCADPASAGAIGAARRIALYRRIRAALAAPVRDFWDSREALDIAFGVQHTGRNDVLSHDLAERLWAAGFAPLERKLGAAERTRWRAVYEALLTPSYLQAQFGLPSAELAARIASIAGYLGECHFEALSAPDCDRNPFLTTVFRGSYGTGEAGLPRYLQSDAHTALLRRKVGGRLSLHLGNVLDFLASETLKGGYDLISLSNVVDWLSDDQLETTIHAARDRLVPGGYVLIRTATERSLDALRSVLELDEDLNAQLASLERGPWFRRIAAGRRVH